MDGRISTESGYGESQSRKSTQKRQEQYFEQKKRQNQNQQQNYDDGMENSVENHREHRSLDVINLQNLSEVAQERRTARPTVIPSCTNTPERKDLGNIFSKRGSGIAGGSPAIQSSSVLQHSDSVEYRETRIPSDFQMETASPKKVSPVAPHSNTNALNGVRSKPDQWKAIAEQPSSVLDLLGDDGLNPGRQESMEQEAHVAFSVSGLGKVGTETPVHSPQQPSRAFRNEFFSPPNGAGKLHIPKKLNFLPDDFEIEDPRMNYVDLPLNGNLSEFSSDHMESLSSPKHKSFSFRDTRHYAGHTSQKTCYFDPQIEDKWDDRSSFQCDDFFDEREHDLSWKTRQTRIDDVTTENLMYRDYNASDFAFESPHLPVRTGEKVRHKVDFLGSTTAYSEHESPEYDFDFPVSNWSRCPIVERKSEFKPRERFTFVTEDGRDSSSLQSEESCSSSAVRYQAFDDPISNATSRQTKRREQSSGFVSSKDKNGKKSFPQESKDRNERENTATGSENFSRKYQSTSFFQENLETKDDLFFEEKGSRVDTNPGFRSTSQNPATINTRFDIWDEDSFSEFLATKQPFGSNRSINEFDDEPVSFSPSAKIPSSKISKPEIPPDPASKRASRDSSSFDLAPKKSMSSEVEYKAKSKPSSYGTFKFGEEFSVTNESPASEDKDVIGTPNKMDYDCEGKEGNTQVVSSLTEPENADVIDISGSINCEKEDRQAADMVPYPYRNDKYENVEEFGPKRRMGNKQKSEYFESPSQGVMLQSYVFQFFCVEKRLKY